jgi:hypothetical protein
MAARGLRLARAAAFGVVAGAAGAAGIAAATPPTLQDVARLCAGADGPAHCGRLVEAEQLKRLPGLAERDGLVLRVTLYPAGVATFTDVDDLDGGRSFSLWDALSEINAVVLYTTVGETVGFRFLQRTNGRSVDLPAEPKLAPDRQRFATADFCATRCTNELAVWRVTRDGVRKEAAWTAGAPWDDATVSWKGADVLVVDYTPAGATTPARLERRLADPGWQRQGTP